MKSDTLIAVEWLWSLRGSEMWLAPSVLTAENKDPASPNLTTVEAVSVFRYLHEKGLIFPEIRDGRTVFRLHESKVKEWNEFIKYLSSTGENLYSSAANTDSDNQSDAQPANKPRDKDSNNLPPANGNNVVEFGIFHFFRNVIIAGVVATGIWLIGEQFHNDGYDKIANAINFIACTVFFTVLPFEATKHWPRPGIVWPLFAMLLCGLAFVFFGLNPEPKPFPHLSLSLSTEDVPNDPVLLTNNFLWRKNFERVFEVQGLLVVPLPHGKTNLVFVVSVRNEPDSLVLAENLKLIMTLPKELACVAGQGWEMGKLGNPGYFGDGKTNAEQTWGFSFSPMLPGFSDVTPPFQILQAAGHGQIYFSILLRAKDSPPEQLTFSLIPISLSSNTPPHKAFVIKGNRTSSNEITFTTQEILENLRK